MIARTQPKFQLGSVVATPGAIEPLQSQQLLASTFISRHHCGDWGDVCEEDAAANEWALANEARILSSYSTPEGKLWIITEADRSSTCLLLPEEY